MRVSNANAGAVTKLKTGIDGFDSISNGGLPVGRTTLVSGTAGSSKTVFAVQFLARGLLDYEEAGVFVTFEETPADIKKNMLSFGWDLASWEAEGKLAIVDASPVVEEESVITGEFDFGALMARLENAVQRVGARRVSLDSLGAVFTKFDNHIIVRSELLRIAASLRSIGVTAVMTAERTDEYGEIARHGVEEFVADNVVVLRNVLENEKRRRTMEILKFRGTDHQKGEYPFSVIADEGIVGVPLSAEMLNQKTSNVRTTSGNGELNEMCGGGFFRDSIVLVSGATGTGKTLMASQFLAGGGADDRCLLFAYEESRDQLIRNADGWGFDFVTMERQGRLKVVCDYPEVMGLEEHLVRMRSLIEEFKPTRIAVDSLSALERGASPKSFREFVLGLTAAIKREQVVGLFTSVTPSLMGGTSITEAHISTITDSIILLRYVELFGEITRGIAVLKMRGSRHDRDIREFAIDQTGMQIGKTFRTVTGIMAGNPTHVAASEQERVADLFRDP
ncbi:MAG: circadian clock protein KaiC [Pseudomonadota bacterium]